jgi:hypothetical protein
MRTGLMVMGASPRRAGGCLIGILLRRKRQRFFLLLRQMKRREPKMWSTEFG